MTFFARLVRRGAMIMSLAVAASVVIVDLASANVIERRNYGYWSYERFAGRNFHSCDIRTQWPRGAQVLMIRLKRSRVDWYYYNRNWNLTPRRRWRETEFDFGYRRFWATSETLSSNRAMYGTVRSDIRGFVNFFRRARRMNIILPTGENISVNLRGSSAAFEAARRCWNRYLRY